MALNHHRKKFAQIPSIRISDLSRNALAPFAGRLSKEKMLAACQRQLYVLPDCQRVETLSARSIHTTMLATWTRCRRRRCARSKFIGFRDGMSFLHSVESTKNDHLFLCVGEN